MPYRVTERTQARRAATRERILRAAHELVASGGFGAASVAAVAARAGVATGSVYRHFSSKADLFAEVFRRAAQHEVDAVAQAGTLAEGVQTFARRALAGRRLARGPPPRRAPAGRARRPGGRGRAPRLPPRLPRLLRATRRRRADRRRAGGRDRRGARRPAGAHRTRPRRGPARRRPRDPLRTTGEPLMAV